MATIRLDAHKPEFHRAAPPQLPVRVATTANVTIATALNVGDTIDGVTLADGDRVLVKNQSTGLQNGVYNAGATPARAFDMLEGVAAYGAVIYVVAGTANGGKTFANTNTTVPTIDTDAITFTDYTPGGSSAPTTADYLVGTSQAGLSAEIVVGTTPGGELGNTWASPTVDATHSGSAHTDFIAKSVLTTQDDIIVRDASAPARLAKGSDGQVLTVDPTTHHILWATPTSGSALTIKDEGTPLATDATSLDFVGAGVVASGATAAKTITIPGPVGMVIVIPLIINGAGAVLGTGVAGDLTIPFGCTVTAWRALADQTGSVAVSIWKDAYANYPPVIGDLMLTASITTSSFNEATGLSHTITAGDTLRYNVDSATTITRVLISLTATRTS